MTVKHDPPPQVETGRAGFSPAAPSMLFQLFATQALPAGYCSLSSTYRLLHRIKLSWLAPRPRHPEADATAQAAFSQLLDCN
jgi:hypothetical protein